MRIAQAHAARSFDKCRVNATNTLESISDEHELVVYDHDDDGAGEAQSGQRDEQGEQCETGNGIRCPEDLYYGIDLLTHRVIKINGLYCITPSFFRAAYRGGQLKDTVVLSETCEFLGVSGSLDTSMADALLAGGAKAVAGYVNNVYTVYSRSMLWDTVNHLILGQTLQESVQHSMDTYGADDLVWYNAQGGKRPHAAAAYPLLFGDVGVRLIEPNAAPVPQVVQQAA